MFADIKTYYQQASLVDKIIIFLIVLFLFTVWFNTRQLRPLLLPAHWSIFIKQPWSILTYGLVHLGFISLAGTLIVFYFIGHLFLDFFKPNKLLVYLVFGQIIGGIAYLLTAAMTDVQASHLSGFNIALSCLFAGLITKIPTYTLRLRFIGDVKIWVIFVVWMVLNFIGLIGVNQAAIVALLMSSLTGALLTYKGSDILSQWIKSKNTTPNKVRQNPNTGYRKSYRMTKVNQQEVDRILDKINAKGYDSLTEEEKVFLFNQKENNGA